MEWTLTISLVLLLAGIALSLIEEWPKQGLTDTSYVTLVLWLSGQSGFVLLAWSLGYLVATVILAVSITATLYAVGRKVYDHRHYLKRSIPPQTRGAA